MAISIFETRMSIFESSKLLVDFDEVTSPKAIPHTSEAALSL
jgi:hypothetical protein